MKMVRTFPLSMNTLRLQAWSDLTLTGFSVLMADTPCHASPFFACLFSWKVLEGSDL